MTDPDQNFIDALACWHCELAHMDFLGWLTDHWICAEPTVLRHVSGQQGRLSVEALRILNEVRETIAGDRDPGFARGQAGHFLWSLGISTAWADQFLTVTSALLAGVAAAHQLSDWQPSADQHLPEEAIEPLTTCLQHYHKAWNLYTPPVQSISGHAAAVTSGDRAIAALDRLHDNFNGDLPEWWTESNWLLVRRLLSFLLGDEDGVARGNENSPEMLLVSKDNGGFLGLTAPVTTALYAEGWSSAYLDPVALGFTVLDQSMLDSLRIAARICRPLLVKHESKMPFQPVSLRITPQPGSLGLALLRGGSAGGLVTAAACATSRCQRLDLRCTASFQVSIADRTRLEDVNRELSIDDVEMKPVAADSIEAKLTSAAFQKAGLNRVFLSWEQKSKPATQIHGWDDWVSRVECNHNLLIVPIKENHTLWDVIDGMTGDERLEQALAAHADSVARDWDAIREAGDHSPRPYRDEKEEHRFDRYVWPGYHIERPNSEQRQQADVPPSDPVEGKGVERHHELLRCLIRDGRSLVVYDRAGAGKTVFSWRIRHEAVSTAVRQELFGGDAPLVVRCDGAWPADDQTRAPLSLCNVLHRELRDTVPDEAFRQQVIQHAIDRQRVILILDGFDQFIPQDRQFVVNLHTDRSHARDRDGCHWIITSRVHTIDELRHKLFDDAHWTRVRIDPFTHEQQEEEYFTDLQDRWREAVPNRKALGDLLSLPLVLRLIRRLIEETSLSNSLPVFRNLSELFVLTSRLLLQRAIERSSEALVDAGLVRDQLKPSEQLQLLEHVLSLLAFQMMLEENYNGLLDDGPDHAIRDFEERASGRFFRELDTALAAPGLPASGRRRLEQQLDRQLEAWRWALEVLKTIELNHRSVTEAYCPERLAFRNRKVLECYAARYITRFSEQADLEDTRDPRNSSVPCLRSFLGDQDWDACWRLAIDMPTEEISREVTTAAFGILFQVPDRHPRPTELMFRAWQVMKRNDFSGLPDILRSYRQQFLEILAGDEQERSRRAAELLWEEDLRQLIESGQTGSWSFDDLRPNAREHPAYALCSDADRGDSLTLTFMMGASPQDNDADEYEKPWREVSIPAFRMATCCVTQQQYAQFEPRYYQYVWDLIDDYAPDMDSPIICTTWYDAFCLALWLGEAYQLPTELQWEGAAWGGIDRRQQPDRVIGVSPYNASFTADHVHHRGGNMLSGTEGSASLYRTLPVRWDAARRECRLAGWVVEPVPEAYQPNAFGLWQMSGNVEEWCLSAWHRNLDEVVNDSKPQVEHESADVHRSLRGGGWNDDGRETRCSYRGEHRAGSDSNGSFRLARTM